MTMSYVTTSQYHIYYTHTHTYVCVYIYIYIYVCMYRKSIACWFKSRTYEMNMLITISIACVYSSHPMNTTWYLSKQSNIGLAIKWLRILSISGIVKSNHLVANPIVPHENCLNTYHRKYLYIYIYTMRILYKTFSNFPNTVTRYDYDTDVGQIWNQFKNMYRRYKLFTI